jgi:1-deoxy-D-xylulose-5-phosphate reductoisomerase
MKLLLLGASGSIGSQTIDVIEKNPQDFTLVGFSVGYRTRCIGNILKKHPSVTHVYMRDYKKVKYYQKKYPHVTFLNEKNDKLESLISLTDNEMVVNALVGFSGLIPSIEALKQNKKLALANKESLVVAGELINQLLDEGKGELFPIDSEHSALWKCLKVDDKNVDKMMLTASGGAFRKLSRDQLVDVKASDALKHPTWVMGAKITIDCATMVNKCFEIIEAGYLYRYPYSKIGVTLHDESYLHSYLKYKDGLYRGELSKPDMRNPIKFALYEGKIPFATQTFSSLDDLKGLHFHEFKLERYPLVALAGTVLTKKGTYGAVLNRSNEVAVNAYLHDEISFLDIERIIFKCMNEHKNKLHPTLEEIVDVDRKINEKAKALVKQIKEGIVK